MKVHLCCGPQQWDGWVNVDMVPFGHNVVADLNKRWEFARDGEVAEIVCKDGFEHVDSAGHFLSEAARILKPGGTLSVWVPHYKNPSAYRVTHVRLLSWSYFNAYPEPHDAVQNLRVTSNRLYIGHENSRLWALPHTLINLVPKWWERMLYASNIGVTFTKMAQDELSQDYKRYVAQQ